MSTTTTTATASKCTFFDNPKPGELNFRYDGRVIPSDKRFDERMLSYVMQGVYATRAERGISSTDYDSLRARISERCDAKRYTFEEYIENRKVLGRSMFFEYIAIRDIFPDMTDDEIFSVNGVGTWSAQYESSRELKALMEYVDKKVAEEKEFEDLRATIIAAFMEGDDS